MDGVTASREYVELAEKAEAKRKEIARRKRELELARTSKEMTYVEEAGDSPTTWTYVVIDEKFIRLVRCVTQARVLRIPAEIEGLPVSALAADACSRNDIVEEIVCPDSIEAIGSCAFRFCERLRRVVLPASVGEFSSSWMSHCPNLEELVLPGELATIDFAVFDNKGIKKLVIGPAVRSIEPGAFQNTQLETLILDERNPFITTDGDALYTNDGSILLALARPVEHYDIKPGCVAIGKKALYGIETLKTVSVPEGVKVFGEFAFSHSGLTSIQTPSTLESIQAKAFFYCKDFTSIQLNEGLKTIGDSAFEQSALEALFIPASIEEIGSSITVATNVVHTGPDCTIEIDSASKSLFLDGEGGLYRRQADGVHMVQLLYREATSYTAWDGVDVVDDYAFAHHASIEDVVFPEGLKRIGASAFRCCGHLRSVSIPDSVAYIGADAFLDTNIERFRVPASLEHLGKNALVTQGAHHGDQMPSLHEVEVSPENEKFYVIAGMLCERRGDKAAVIIFANNESDVIIPDEVNRIEDYAFNNARGISYLELRPGIETIGTAGLTVWCWIEHIHVEVAEPVEGRTVFDFYFPNMSKGIHAISQGVGGASWVNVPGIMAQYDNCIASAHDYNYPRNTDSIPIYDQVSKIVARLDDPILLLPTNRNLFDRILKWHVEEICVDIARHDDRYLVDRLLDLGYLNEDNLESAIAAVNKLQDAAMTGYLLEVKRRRFNRSVFDFDL